MNLRWWQAYLFCIGVNVLLTIVGTALFNMITPWHAAVLGFGTVIIAPLLGSIEARWLYRAVRR